MPPSDTPPQTEEAPPTRLTREGLTETFRLFSYTRPYAHKFILAQICLLVSSLTGLAFPYCTGRLIDSANLSVVRSPAEHPTAIDTANINATTLLLLSVLILQSVTSAFQTYWLTEVGERSLADLRRDTYARLIRLPMSFFGQRRVGELTSRLATDLSVIQGTLTGAVPQFLGQLITLVGGIVLITITSSRLALGILITLPLILIIAVIFGKRVHKIAREAQDRLAETNVIVEETLQSIVSVKSFTNEGYEATRYRNGMERFILVALRGARLQGAFGGVMSFLGFGSIVSVIWYGTRLVASGDLTFGQMTRFLLYAMYVGGAMGGITHLYGELRRAMGATQRVRELLQETPEDTPLLMTEQPTPEPISGSISFENVTFAYPARNEVVVLKNLSLSAKSGQRIALVGPSGGGKSTIVSLLMRFYDPDLGRVLIDGKEARGYSLHALRASMAIVPQEVLLFGGTIAENIAYGRPGASQTEVEEAARKANAHLFISEFPEGYETIVGERGVKLSGGQRQRVAIARAILRNPAILILDEATSSLDSESESLVQQALETLMQGRTSVIIAHRLATIREADCIYVIKDGEVVEQGTHAELVAHEEGVYRNLSELQFDQALQLSQA
ncbi:multidrug ABC transporter ATP-binding protein [Armatimonadota bacterium]|nr:multidrug ABC transporter ATP-binding protein [Armatimonadota bacterium]